MFLLIMNNYSDVFVSTIETASIEEAREEAEKQILKIGLGNVQLASLCEVVNSEPVNVLALRAKMFIQQEAERAAQTEAEERALLKKLQAKYP